MIPIVFVITQDPVGAGYVDSLARPGGNITGITRLTRGLSGKRLELLKETIPTISRIAILWSGAGNGFKRYEAAASKLKMALESLDLRSPDPDIEGAIQAAKRLKLTHSSRLQISGSLVT